MLDMGSTSHSSLQAGDTIDLTRGERKGVLQLQRFPRKRSEGEIASGLLKIGWLDEMLKSRKCNEDASEE